jgi:non-ribosomal peptide synthetase component F
LLARAREVTLGAYAHQDAPFEKIVEVIQPDRNLGRNPIFQVWFFFQNVSRAGSSPHGISAGPLDANSGLSRFDISLGLYEVGEGIAGGFEYNSDLFEPSTMARLARHYETILKQVSADPDTKLSELKTMLDESESQSQATKITEQKRVMREKLKSAQRKVTAISLSTDQKCN